MIVTITDGVENSAVTGDVVPVEPRCRAFWRWFNLARECESRNLTVAR